MHVKIVRRESMEEVPLAAGFDAAAAAHYGTFVSVAYAMYRAEATNPTPKPLPLPAGYKFIAWVQMKDFILFSGDWTFYGLIAQSAADPNNFVLAIRGTVNAEEWWDDLTSLHLAHWAGFGLVGYGFDRIYRTLRVVDATQPTVSAAAMAESIEPAGTFAQQVAATTRRHAPAAAASPQMAEAEVQPSKRIDVVGHSLGAALATLYVAENANMGANLPGTQGAIRTPLLYTFASPRVGDATFASSFDALGVTSWRVFNELDLVPFLPPSIFGFVHVDTGQRINPGGLVRPTLACEHSLATYLHMLDPKLPLDPGCVVPPKSALTARVAPPPAAAMEMTAAPSAALFEKTLEAAAAPAGHGTTVTIKITIEGGG
jgi:hypothetical protein